MPAVPSGAYQIHVVPSAELQAKARRFVLWMGLVAMFGDLTYEGARGLSGAYLALLGASATAIGFFAGLGELLGHGLRLISGWLADRTGRRWTLTALGYALNLLAVPGLALVGRWELAVVLVLLERIGKAIRSPARATLVAAAAKKIGTGHGFGLEEALDQLGAVGGPLLTAVVLSLAPGSQQERLQSAFAVLLLPVLATLLTLWWARRHQLPAEEEAPPSPARPNGTSRAELGLLIGAGLVGLGSADWALVALHGISELNLEARDVALLYALAMGIDGIAALGFGALYDRAGPRVLVLSAVISALTAPLIFGGAGSSALLGGVITFGVGLGAQESIYKAALADRVPAERRGRAYGRFFAAYGLSWWIGSAVLGWAYDHQRAGVVAFSMLAHLLAIPFFWRLGRASE